MALLTEFDKTPECEGVPIPILLKDAELMTYKNSRQMNFDFMWKNNPYKTTGEWYHVSFRWDLYERIKKFFEFMKDDRFSGKTVHVYTHGGFVGNIPSINTGIYNYQTVKLEYNQETGESVAEFI